MEIDLFLKFVSDPLALVPLISFSLKDGFAPLVSGLLNAALYTVVWLAGEEQLADEQTVIESLATVGPVLLARALS